MLTSEQEQLLDNSDLISFLAECAPTYYEIVDADPYGEEVFHAARDLGLTTLEEGAIGPPEDWERQWISHITPLGAAVVAALDELRGYRAGTIDETEARRLYERHGYDPYHQFGGGFRHQCQTTSCPRRFARYPNCEGCAGPGEESER